MFCSGTILQTFMLNVGMTDAEVSTYNAVIQIVQTCVIFAMAFLADKIRRVLKVYTSIILSVSIIAVALLFCVFVRSNLDTVKWIIFGSSIVTYFMIGVRNGVDYRIYYDIFDMRDVGSMMGAAIAISGLVSFGISVAYSFMVKKLDYYDVMTMFFILSSPWETERRTLYSGASVPSSSRRADPLSRYGTGKRRRDSPDPCRSD